MKKLSVLTALLFCLFLTGAAFAQNKTAANFAGVWELDAAKSKFPERMRVESGTLTVTQTDKQLTVATDFKRAPRPENAPPQQPNENGGMRPEGNRGGGMRGGGGGMMGGGNGTATYNLDGKEVAVESETPAGMPPSSLKLKAEAEKDGKLKLISSRSFETQMGAMTVKTVEVWELLDNGKTLKITRDTETPRGSQSAEMYFTKVRMVGVSINNQGAVTTDGVSAQNTVENVYQAPVNSNENNTTSAQDSSVRTINGGVINGKSTKLPQPEYPPAAKAVKASGTVNIEVVLDEFGKVISASAVSGNPLLKAAAEKAARAAEFAPTRLSGAPVRVRGIITYNFIL